MNIYDVKHETMSRNELKSLQLSRLKEIVTYAYERVPFYKKKYDEAGVKPSDIKTLEDIQKLPFVTKADLRENYPYGFLAVPVSELARIHASSGTSGKPTVVAYTKEDMENWTECVARLVVAAGGRSDDIVQICFGYGLFTGALGLHQGWERIGAAVIPASTGNSERQLMLMKDLGATAIVATPSYALHLAEVMEKSGMKPEDFKLRVGMFGSEASSEEMHRELAEKLHLFPTDNYGLSELIGPGVSGECEYKCGMHINEDHFYPEIVDPATLEPTDGSDYGELVLTSLTKKSMPMIRYRTKDVTKIDYSPCKCGRTTARMAKLKGRTDDMLIIKGVNVFPSQIEGVLLSFKEVGSTYEIIVTREDYKDKLEVKVELVDDSIVGDYGAIEKLSKDIRHALRTVLQIDAKLTITEHMSLARSEGKAKRVIDLRKY
ncbi:MAG TPA: phenylacetate--CoA ligase [Candidatus Protoclostridium stercorigallinarum]|uniref:Phenylacetate-coenzyme A ligase n=1 Tax=Candidatus Protoclostridium stercorigallinarum TaxID=2838741 RepID=A0A9D1PZP5_9FIRM|nr:phenylacetate--CoA ligase [Candidatus Protoclostridium stercorigallinarum]